VAAKHVDNIHAAVIRAAEMVSALKGDKTVVGHVALEGVGSQTDPVGIVFVESDRVVEIESPVFSKKPTHGDLRILADLVSNAARKLDKDIAVSWSLAIALPGAATLCRDLAKMGWTLLPNSDLPINHIIMQYGAPLPTSIADTLHALIQLFAKLQSTDDDLVSVVDVFKNLVFPAGDVMKPIMQISLIRGEQGWTGAPVYGLAPLNSFEQISLNAELYKTSAQCSMSELTRSMFVASSKTLRVVDRRDIRGSGASKLSQGAFSLVDYTRRPNDMEYAVYTSEGPSPLDYAELYVNYSLSRLRGKRARSIAFVLTRRGLACISLSGPVKNFIKKYSVDEYTQEYYESLSQVALDAVHDQAVEAVKRAVERQFQTSSDAGKKGSSATSMQEFTVADLRQASTDMSLELQSLLSQNSAWYEEHAKIRHKKHDLQRVHSLAATQDELLYHADQALAATLGEAERRLTALKEWAVAKHMIRFAIELGDLDLEFFRALITRVVDPLYRRKISTADSVFRTSLVTKPQLLQEFSVLYE